MMDEKVKPVQRITYNSNNYQRFENDDEDDDCDGNVLRAVSSTSATECAQPQTAAD